MRPGAKTIDQLIQIVRDRADQPEGGAIEDSVIEDLLQSAYGELYDLLVESGEHYYSSSSTVTTDSSGAIDLPDDFLRADGTDVQYSTDPGSRKYPLRRLNFQDRNVYTAWGGGIVGYIIRGEKMYLYPSPPAGYTITLHYTPRAAQFGRSGTIQLLPEIALNDTVTVNDQVFTSIDNSYGTRVGVIICTATPRTIPANTTIMYGNFTFRTLESVTTWYPEEWQANHAYPLTSHLLVRAGKYLLYSPFGDATSGSTMPAGPYELGEGGIIDGNLTWGCWGIGGDSTVCMAQTTLGQQSNQLTITTGDPTAEPPTQPTWYAESPASTFTYTISSIVNEWIATYSAVPTVTGQFFFPSGPDLAARFNYIAGNSALGLYDLTAVGVGDTITITSTRPSSVLIKDISPTIYVPTQQWQSYVDCFDGWEELMILTAVIGIRNKLEEDPSAEIAGKDRLLQRLHKSVLHRDQSGVVPIGDCMGTNDYWNPWRY